MKLDIKKHNLEPLCRLLQFTTEPDEDSVSNEDIENLFESAAHVAFRVYSGDDLTEILHNADPKEIECTAARKALLVVRCTLPFRVTCLELAELYRFLSDNLPHAEVRWRFATGLKKNEKVTLIIVTTY